MRSLLLDFSKTGNDILVQPYSVDVLEEDTDTYNADNPFIICSEATNNKSIDLTNAHFVRVYDSSIKSLRTLIEVQCENTYIDENDEPRKCYRVTDDFIFDTEKCVLLSNLPLFNSVYSDEFYKYGIKLKKNEVLYAKIPARDENDTDHELLLQHTTFHNVLSRKGITSHRYYNGINDSAEHIFDLIKGTPLNESAKLELAEKYSDEDLKRMLDNMHHWSNYRDYYRIVDSLNANTYMSAIRDAINANAVYDADSDFVKNLCQPTKIVLTYDAIIKTITDCGFKITDSVCNITYKDTFYFYCYECNVKTKNGKLVGHIETEDTCAKLPYNTIRLSFPAGDDAGFKSIDLPFTNEELTALGIDDHWDSMLEIDLDINDTENDAVKITKNIFTAIKAANKKSSSKTMNIRALSNNIISEKEFNAFVHFGNTIGMLKIKDNTGYFNSDTMNIATRFGRSSTALCTFLTIFTILSDNELHDYVEEYANAHYMQIETMNKKGKHLSDKNIAKHIVDAYLMQNMLTPKDIVILNGTISAIIDDGNNVRNRTAVCDITNLQNFNNCEAPKTIMLKDGSMHNVQDYDGCIIKNLMQISNHSKMYIVGESVRKEYDKTIHPTHRTLNSHVTDLLSFCRKEQTKSGKLKLIDTDTRKTDNYKATVYELQNTHFVKYYLIIKKDKQSKTIKAMFVNYKGMIWSGSTLNFNDHECVSLNIDMSSIASNKIWDLANKMYDMFKCIHQISHPND